MTLAEQAASDTSGLDSSSSKSAINDEYNAILQELDRIAATVEFNGMELLSGSGTSIDVQVGLGATIDDRITVSTSAVTGSGLGLSSGAMLTKSGARAELAEIQSAIDAVSADRGDLGAAYNRLQHTISVIAVQAQNLQAAEAQIRDANIAEEVVDLASFQVLTQTGIAALAQANSAAQNVLALLG
jgi:flagellin